ncbi:MAG: DUF6132 family protein [Bacteroidales bacterium]|nr:DUF6132 family protein [Bacteroidales bacterium]MDD3860448.1 DUF6132 family protein [Bacteroidales bacterium]
MNTFRKKLIFRISLSVLGGLGGFLYWKYVGCASGACPLQSKWYITSLYGFVIGYLVSGLFITDKLKKDIKSEIDNNDKKDS